MESECTALMKAAWLWARSLTICDHQSSLAALEMDDRNPQKRVNCSCASVCMCEVESRPGVEERKRMYLSNCLIRPDGWESVSVCVRDQAAALGSAKLCCSLTRQTAHRAGNTTHEIPYECMKRISERSRCSTGV